VRSIVAAVVSLSLLAVSGVASAQTTGTATAGPFTISAEALLWWFKGNATPPLVTDGVLGDPGTKILLGGEDLDTNPNPGFRLTAGYAFSEQWGLETSVFYIPSRTTRGAVSSSGAFDSEDIYVPIVDATIPEESVSNLSSAGIYSGAATAKLSNNLLGAELNGTLRVAAGPGWRLDGIAGLRYLRLHESFRFTTSSPFVPPFPADVYQTTDQFDATNHFLGAQLGLRARLDRGPWFATAVAKVALGAVRQHVDIEGTLLTNDFNDFGTPIAYPGGGYFAAPTNIGSRSRHVFGVVPEAGLTLGYRLTPWLALTAGYTFLYVNDVVRAPNQINRTVNYSDANAPPAPPSGPQEPSFKFKSSDFWAQGLSLGLAFRF
jgi:hypothetical protein